MDTRHHHLQSIVQSGKETPSRFEGAGLSLQSTSHLLSHLNKPLWDDPLPLQDPKTVTWRDPLKTQLAAVNPVPIWTLMRHRAPSGWVLRPPLYDPADGPYASSKVDETDLLAECVQVYQAGQWPFILLTPEPVLFASPDPGGLLRAMDANWSPPLHHIAPVPTLRIDPCPNDFPNDRSSLTDTEWGHGEGVARDLLILLLNEGPLCIYPNHYGFRRFVDRSKMVVCTPSQAIRVCRDRVHDYDYPSNTPLYQRRTQLANRIVWTPTRLPDPATITHTDILLTDHVLHTTALWLAKAIDDPAITRIQVARVVHGRLDMTPGLDEANVIAIELAVTRNHAHNTVDMVYIQQRLTRPN